MKVSILGAAGCIGMSAAFEIATSRLADEMVLLDVRENVARHHAMDLSTAVSALDVSVRAGRYEDTAGSDVVVHAAGIHGDITADRSAMLVENIRASGEIARQLRKHCADAIVITVVNPVDALNWTVWRAGGFERRQIVGYSFNDTLRFREFAAQEKAVEVSRVEGLTIGEHGFTQVQLFSSVRIDGRPVSFSDDEKQRMRGAYRGYFEPLLNSEWVDSAVFRLGPGVKGGRSPAQRTLDAGPQPLRWPLWPMRHADASAIASRSDSYA